MDGDPFLVDIRLNGTDFTTGLVDYGCLCYAAINEQLFRSLKLPQIPIPPRKVENATDNPNTVIDTVTYVSVDIDGHQRQRVFFYVILKLNYSIILGKPWMEDEDVYISVKKGCLTIRSLGVWVWNRAKQPAPNVKIKQVMASVFMAEVRRDKRRQGTGVFSVTLKDIDKALKPKTRTDPKEKLPKHYHQ